jgi:endonuclease G
MKKLLLILILFTFNITFAQDCYKEIHCKHFFYGYPTGVPASNDLIIRDSYALSSNDSTKFADWVAYRLDSLTLTGQTIDRAWKADPWLDESETLEPDDYKDANKTDHYDRGHQAPLANFKGNRDIETTNYLSNITPQKAELNQGSWKNLEDIERKLVGKFHEIYVMTGPLYESALPSMPKADEYHRVPSGYWKIIAIPFDDESFKIYGFIFAQTTPRKSEVKEHLVKIDEIEKRSKLDFLRLLDKNTEKKVESQIDLKWFDENVGKK